MLSHVSQLRHGLGPVPLLCCGVTWDRLNIVRKRFLSSSSGARSISSGVKRVLSGGGGGAARLALSAGGEGLRSRSILRRFRRFCCTRSSRRPTVVRPNTPRKSSFWSGGKKRGRGEGGDVTLIHCNFSCHGVKQHIHVVCSFHAASYPEAILDSVVFQDFPKVPQTVICAVCE